MDKIIPTFFYGKKGYKNEKLRIVSQLVQPLVTYVKRHSRKSWKLIYHRVCKMQIQDGFYFFIFDGRK